ncbi:hypothetical protein VY88_26420 [Azospirillum thiophilum]|uniref:Uncharacterized protein n=1 Tax=Azospirillum thiophilum TaxID=528244 RepID=A0AAC9EYL1_9PROT|nr:hypothetical protein [Azospirillum thiophilum]ALG75069.1 hypothetical protein AL072_29330 [Azospirillum thiophilum]KJR62462.1 hypothetical protein VY88_26420 [Azospirillum thiophilum]
MAFDIIVPARGQHRRADADKVRVAMGKTTGKSPILELRVVIGSDLVKRFGWTKGQRVNLAFGREASAERGQLAIMPAEDGHFRLVGGKSLEVRTRTLHPTLKLLAAPSTIAPPVQLVTDRLIVRMPDTFMAPRPMDSLMGDPPTKRKG